MIAVCICIVDPPTSTYPVQYILVYGAADIFYFGRISVNCCQNTVCPLSQWGDDNIL